MKWTTCLIALTSVAVLAGGAGPAMADDGRDAKYHMDRIRRAPGPEEAIDAYHRGRLRLGGNVRLDEAYARKMIDFGQVHLLGTLATRLVAQDEDHAIGNALLAWRYAQVGRMVEAFKHMERAADEDDDEPFVQDMGGQLIAWYDVTREERDLPEKIDDAAEEIEDELDDKRIYKDSYRAARAELLGQRDFFPPYLRSEPRPEYRYKHRGRVIVPGLRFFFSWPGRDRRFDDDHFKFDDDDHRRFRFDDDDDFEDRFEFDDDKFERRFKSDGHEFRERHDFDDGRHRRRFKHDDDEFEFDDDDFEFDDGEFEWDD